VAQQTVLVVSYGSSSSATLPIPPALINTASGVTDWYTAARNLFLSGGFVVPGTTTFIPWGQVTQVVAS